MKKIIVLLVFLFSTATWATEYARGPFTINVLQAVAFDRPEVSVAANTLRVYINEVADFGPNCASQWADLVDMNTTNRHVYATLLLAKAMNRPIYIYVEDTLHPVVPTSCQITTVDLH